MGLRLRPDTPREWRFPDVVEEPRGTATGHARARRLVLAAMSIRALFLLLFVTLIALLGVVFHLMVRAVVTPTRKSENDSPVI